MNDSLYDEIDDYHIHCRNFRHELSPRSAPMKNDSLFEKEQDNNKEEDHYFSIVELAEPVDWVRVYRYADLETATGVLYTYDQIEKMESGNTFENYYRANEYGGILVFDHQKLEKYITDQFDASAKLKHYKIRIPNANWEEIVNQAHNCCYKLRNVYSNQMSLDEDDVCIIRLYKATREEQEEAFKKEAESKYKKKVLDNKKATEIRTAVGADLFEWLVGIRVQLNRNNTALMLRHAISWRDVSAKPLSFDELETLVNRSIDWRASERARYDMERRACLVKELTDWFWKTMKKDKITKAILERYKERNSK